MENFDDGSFDVPKAEVFEALGHPTRIRILRALSERPLAFSKLKHEAEIQSNGLLSFHLGKLSGLVKSTEEGNYALSEEGREALRIIEATRIGSGLNGNPTGTTRRIAMSKMILGGLLICIIILGVVVVYQQQIIAGRNAQSSSRTLGQLSVTYNVPSDPSVASFSTSWYRNGSHWAALFPGYQGNWYAGTGLKVLWYRSDNSTFAKQLTVTAVYLNSSATSANETIMLDQFVCGTTCIYSKYDYQPSSLYFPSTGYWLVTGREGTLVLNFLVYVLPHSSCPSTLC